MNWPWPWRTLIAGDEEPHGASVIVLLLLLKGSMS